MSVSTQLDSEYRQRYSLLCAIYSGGILNPLGGVA